MAELVIEIGTAVSFNSETQTAETRAPPCVTPSGIGCFLLDADVGESLATDHYRLNEKEGRENAAEMCWSGTRLLIKHRVSVCHCVAQVLFPPLAPLI